MADVGIGILVPVRKDGTGSVDPNIFGAMSPGRDVPIHPRPTAKNQGIGVTYLTRKKNKQN